MLTSLSAQAAKQVGLFARIKHCLTLMALGMTFLVTAHAHPYKTSQIALSAPASSTVDQAITLTASIKGHKPAGTVTFEADGVAIGSATIDSGKPSVSVSVSASLLTAGTHNLTAVYSGDTENSASTSSTVTVSVAQAATATTLTVPATATVDQSLTLTAAVSGSHPSGTVTFQDGGATIGSGTLSAGQASINLPVQNAGSHRFTALYAGDANYQASTSAAASVTANPAATATTMTVSPTLVLIGQATTLTATVSGDHPSGTVTFQDGGTTLGSAPLNAGQASWSGSFTTSGTHSLTAVYAGDTNYRTSTSAATSLVVNAPPSVAITVPANHTVMAAPADITLNANATDSDGTIAKVDFYNGTTLIGTATAAPYTATWNNVPAGDYTITAQATDNLGASTSSVAVPVTVDAPPAISITAPANDALFANQGTINVTANATDSDGTIAKVDFYHGTTLIGTATAAPYTATWSHVPQGSYTITAQATDNQGIATTSAAIGVTVVAPPATTLTTGGSTPYISPANVTLNASATPAQAGVTITQVAFYSGATLLGTTATAPYSFNWSSVQAGTYSITAQATDSVGNTATSSPANVTVIANTPPSVSLAATPEHGTAPLDVVLTASANDSDGTVASVEFFKNGQSLGIVTQAPYTKTVTGLETGNDSFTAKATDNLGAATSSQPVVVTVGKGIAKVYYIYSDHLNAPRVITDSSDNNIVWRWDDSDPFGASQPDSNPSGLGTFTYNQRFPGQMYDQETNLFYNNNRYYNPQAGRYIQSDLIGNILYKDMAVKLLSTYGPVDPNMVGHLYSQIPIYNHLYAYVAGNPISATDSLGLKMFCLPGMKCWSDQLPPTDKIPPKDPKDLKKPIDKDKRYSCSENSPSLGACLACCASRGAGQYPSEPGSICSEKCYQKAGITQADTDEPKMCPVGEKQ